MNNKVSGSESRVRTEELTNRLSNGESGNKGKDSEKFHDDDGEGRKGRAAVKERLSLFVL